MSDADDRLHREMDYVVNEIGVPTEDAREIAEQRLGRRYEQPRRRHRGPLDMLGEDIRRSKERENKIRPTAPTLPFTKTLNIGGAKARIEVRK